MFIKFHCVNTVEGKKKIRKIRKEKFGIFLLN